MNRKTYILRIAYSHTDSTDTWYAYAIYPGFRYDQLWEFLDMRFHVGEGIELRQVPDNAIGSFFFVQDRPRKEDESPSVGFQYESEFHCTPEDLWNASKDVPLPKQPDWAQGLPEYKHSSDGLQK
ncbi:MAG: hypothetical protein JNN17_04820 [Verrucomicrobiaceae bacterium]|nr:hypothetical protein [Verrucomicrobiaceae bacterium]